MTPIELAADILQRDLKTLTMTLADFTEAEMFVRPCPGANHAAWQLGHLIAAESHIVNGAWPNAVPALPAEFVGKFNKQTASIDSPEAFASKEQLIHAFSTARAHTVAWVKKLTLEDLSKPVGGPMAEWVPTIGHVVFILPGHTNMHVGQFQVIRRKLGKPILF
jgi:hypothetical protein